MVENPGWMCRFWGGSTCYLAEVHRAVFPAASVDATLAVLAVVEVFWSRMRGRQQTCREGGVVDFYTEQI